MVKRTKKIMNEREKVKKNVLLFRCCADVFRVEMLDCSDQWTVRLRTNEEVNLNQWSHSLSLSCPQNWTKKKKISALVLLLPSPISLSLSHIHTHTHAHTHFLSLSRYLPNVTFQSFLLNQSPWVVDEWVPHTNNPPQNVADSCKHREWQNPKQTTYIVYRRFGQTKFSDCGLVLDSSQCSILPQLPKKIRLDSKVVKIDPKIIISLR